MKNKLNTKTGFLTVIGVVAALALLVSGVFIYAVYETVLKPAEFTYTEPASGDNTGYYRYCYSELTVEEQRVYSVIMQSIYDMPEKIEIPELGTGNLDNIFTALSYDNPDLFCLGGTCTVYTEGYKTFFEPTYSMTAEEYKERLVEVKNIAAAIANAANTFTSVYEKELYVHDYLINHCIYAEATEGSMANNIYGCLVEGKAACEGYSRAFQYILSQLNIDNRLVTGESAEDGVNYIGHMWNYVVIEGQGYFVDVTWDDPKTSGSVLRHTYFNVNTNDILLEHTIDQTLPLCTATKYNYFVYENAYLPIGAGEVFEMYVDNAVHSALQRGYKYVELRFSDASVMDQARNSLFNGGVIYNVYRDEGILPQLGGSKVYYSSYENMNVICLFF